MKNYNDFPLLSDNLYLKMEEEYKLQSTFDESMLVEIYSHILTFFQSINLIDGLRTRDKNIFNIFSQEVIDLFNQNYPNLKPKKIKENGNIFYLFNLLINCLQILEKMQKNKINQNNYDFCNILKEKIFKFFNEIFSSLETQYIKFFKHM